MSLAPGARLGPYEIAGRLGAGGMGEVWRARDTRLGRDVAIKVLPDDVSDDLKALARFESEARAVAALSHPNILALYDVGEENGVRYAVTELLQGETLREALEHGAFPVRRALEISEQIAKGLAAAHEKGIVHRDVKPENVFLTKGGEAKLLDFGLARHTIPSSSTADTQSPTSPVLTTSGAVVGTVAYMSPEQARGLPFDHRSDQFSLGIVLYEMLTDRRPFRGDSLAETLTAIIREEPEPLEKTAPSTPAPVRWIVERCLKKEPDERYDSTRDLARDVATCRLHLSEARLTGGVSEVKPVRRRWPKVAAMTAAAAVLAGIGYLGARLPRDQDVPTFQRLTFRNGAVPVARFAPDWQTVVFSASWDGQSPKIYTTRPGSAEAHDLGLPPGLLWAVSRTGDILFTDWRPNAGSPWSVLYRSSLSGEAPRALVEDVWQADFSPDGKEIAVNRAAKGRKSLAWRLEYPIGKVLREGSPNMLQGLKVSEDGQRVAFGEEGGGAFVVDRSGRVVPILPDKEGRGWRFAWAKRTGRLWLSYAHGGADRWAPNAVWEVVGPQDLRPRLRGTSGLSLQDTAPDGRLLVIEWRARHKLYLLEPGAAQPRDLSWLSMSVPADISDDGRTVLLTDTNGKSQGGSVYLRRTDGTPAVRLGEGSAIALSRDGLWALASNNGLLLYPTGPGQPRAVKTDGIETDDVAFFPDGKRLLVVGQRKGGPSQSFVVPLDGGTPTPVGPESIREALLSDEGRWLCVRTGDGKHSLVPLDGGAVRPIEGLRPDDFLMRVRADAGVLFVRRFEGSAVRVDAVELAGGRRKEIAQIRSTSPAIFPGGLGYVFMTPDAKTFLYSDSSSTSDLYLVEGLK